MYLEFESERLYFRPLDENDLDLEIALWTDAEVARFITGEKSTVPEIEKLMPIVTQRAGNGCVGLWCLIEKPTRKKIGHVALLPLPTVAEDTEFELLQSDDWPDRDIEIGFVLKRDFWNLGYATEACAGLLAFTFQETELDTIFATTDPKNHASRKVLRKTGMREIGLIPAFGAKYPGFKLTRQEWMTKGRSPKDARPERSATRGHF